MTVAAAVKQDLLTIYAERGLRLCYWLRVGSNPQEWKGPHIKGWNDPDRQYPLDLYDPKTMNLGTFDGHEIAPGKFHADVDFDWAPGTVLARKILPWTDFGFGRKGKDISHAFYTTPERLTFIDYYDLADAPDTGGKGLKFVELFSGDADGNSKHQTMIAPSLHSPGVYVELTNSGNIGHYDKHILEAGVLDYAIGCLLLKRVLGGLHHEGRVALAGLLLKYGVSAVRVQTLMEAVCDAQMRTFVPDMSSADIKDCAVVVKSTLERIAKKKKYAAGPKFATFCGARGKEIVARLNEWLNRDGDFYRVEGKIVAKNQQNIRRAVELLGHELSCNSFTQKLLIDARPMEDHLINDVLLKIEDEHHFSPPIDYFKMVIENTAWRNSSHPVNDYLDKLKWDNVPRIDTWLITCAKADDSAYIRAISSIMLIAAVRRIKSPGCKYDEMVVWESPQGFEKSSAAQALCPNPAWFSDDFRLNLNSQQLIEATLGKWIIEVSDLAGKSKRQTDIDTLKAMLSRQVDGPCRMAYGHFPLERPRHFILIGTTNSPAYLIDSTGARRFWPMKLQRFNVEWIKAHRDQLWAEAVHREKERESIRLKESLWSAAETQQEKRREIDPWEHLIRDALLMIKPSGDEKRRVHTAALWDVLGIDVNRRDRTGALRLSEIMHRLGFKRTNVRIDSELGPGYVGGNHALVLDEDIEPSDEKNDDVPADTHEFAVVNDESNPYDRRDDDDSQF